MEPPDPTETPEAQPTPTPDNFVREAAVRAKNWLGDGARLLTGTGPQWSMSTRLARELVAKQNVFCLPLVSGIQFPIYDAVNHLMATHDTQAVSALQSLYSTVAGEGWGGFRVTTNHGEIDEIKSSRLQEHTAKALIKLLPAHDRQRFVLEQLEKGVKLHAGLPTFVKQAVKDEQFELAESLLQQAEEAKDLLLQQLIHHNNEGLSELLTQSEWLHAGAYCLAADRETKEAALDGLIDQYNAVAESGETWLNNSFVPKFILEKIHSQEQPRVLARLKSQDLAQELENARRNPDHRLFSD